MLTLRAVLPTAGDSIRYRQRGSTLRSIVKRYDANETAELLEFFLSALFNCHVDYLGLCGFIALDCLATLISQYAPAIGVKHLYCAYLTLAADPFELDHAKFYAAFERFASIQSVTCSSSCATAIVNQLRNFCTAKQITFATV